MEDDFGHVIGLDELLAVADEQVIKNGAEADSELYVASVALERGGDFEGALALNDRARDVGGELPRGLFEAHGGELLLKLGRHDEGLARLAALRPKLRTDQRFVAHLVTTLLKFGHAVIAEEWLTAALPEGLIEHPAAALERPLADVLAHRARIRAELGMPVDAVDRLAGRLGLVGQEPAGDLFWPEEEFERLLRTWPALGARFGENWDQHRGIVERHMVARAAAHPGPYQVYPGDVDELIAIAGGGDPADPAVIADYRADLAEQSWPGFPWPPAAGDPCWCDSPHTYEQCCLPRSRS